jgi:hypothetical protein
VLRLGFENLMSEAAFVFVGVLCPRLTHLDLNATCNLALLRSVDNMAPLFPELVMLVVRDTYWALEERYVVTTLLKSLSSKKSRLTFFNR